MVTSGVTGVPLVIVVITNLRSCLNTPDSLALGTLWHRSQLPAAHLGVLGTCHPVLSGCQPTRITEGFYLHVVFDASLDPRSKQNVNFPSTPLSSCKLQFHDASKLLFSISCYHYCLRPGVHGIRAIFQDVSTCYSCKLSYDVLQLNQHSIYWDDLSNKLEFEFNTSLADSLQHL